MSLSTLGAQLAAINAPGKNVGAALPSSRRHEDAIGRGLSHSVQVGHSIANKSHLHKPSIIYEDSRKASDVPIATIRENCVASLRQLESLDPEFGPFVEAICKPNAHERGLLTSADNEKVDSLIEDLLYRLALHMNKRATTASCLHVVEFLLRRYDIHLRPKTATTALLVMLPHHEEPFFLRLLQLIDLASMSTFFFLRPYAIPGAKLARPIIAKQAAKDIALVREICRLSQRYSQVPNAVHSFSFTAAVLVEALTLQTQRSGSMDERTCQALLPFVVAACRQSKTEGYQNWGHILASTIVETSVLAEEPRQVLVVSILQGLERATEEVVANGLVVALTILAQPLDEVDISIFSLPMIGLASSCGYAMDKNVFQALLRLENLSARFGEMYEDEGFVDVSHWVASILVVGWKRLEKKGKKNKKAREVITAFIREPKLRSLWKDNNGKWIESFCSFVITNTPDAVRLDTTDEENYVQCVLQDLRRMDVVAYEKGLTHTLVCTKREDRNELAAWLGLTKPQNDEKDSQPMILPPRVALEHADFEERLQAIPRVLEENDSNDPMEFDGGETVQEALLRRLIVDNKDEVALAAAKGLCRLVETRNTMDNRELGKGSLRALYKWTESSYVDKKRRPLLVMQILRIVASAARCVMAEENVDEMLVKLVEGIGAHLGDSDKDISQEAAKSIAFVFNGKRSPEKNAQQLLVSDDRLLNGYTRIVGGARRTEQALRRRTMQILLTAFKESLAAGQRSRKNDDSISEKANETTDYCLWAIDFYSDNLDKSELDLLSDCLSMTTKYAALTPEKIPSTFLRLAEHGGDIFSKVVVPFIKGVTQHIKDKDGEKVAGIAVIMEISLAASTSIAVENLLSLASQYMQSESDAALCHYGFVPALALVAHPNDLIRKKAVDLVCLIGECLGKRSGTEWKSLAALARYVSENRSSAIMGGSSFLPGCFTAVTATAGKDFAFQKCFLDLCVCTLTASTKSPPSESFGKGWLNTAECLGAQKTVVTLLKAAECAGEAAFPLATRWQHAGKPILDSLLKSGSSGDEVQTLLMTLVDTLVRMLKGVKVIDPSSHSESALNTIIMSGPASRGGRTRSYSFGKNDDLTFLDPYPKEMHVSMLSVLSDNKGNEHSRQMRSSLFRTVLCSQSWGKGVFVNLPRTIRQNISSALLILATQDLNESAEEALFSLPLTAADVAEILEKDKKPAQLLVTISYLADFTSTNSRRLIGDSSAGNLISVLFKKLSSLSSESSDDDEAIDFARQSILTALLELLEASRDDSNSTARLSKESKFGDWISLLISIIGGDGKTNIRRLESIRSKRTTFSLLTSLCSKYPSAVVNKLIPAVTAIVLNTSSEREASISAEFFALLVPVYFEHSSTGNLLPIHLFNAFIAAVRKKDDKGLRIKLYQGFVDALTSVIEANDVTIGVVGAFASACIAGEVHYAHQGDSAEPTNETLSLPQMATLVLHHTSIPTKVLAVSTMLSYSKDIIATLMGGGGSLDSTDNLLSVEDLVSIAKFGPPNGVSKASKKKGQGKLKNAFSASDESITKLCSVLLEAVAGTVSSPAFRKFIKKVKGDTSTMVLRLWQDLLLIQSACHNCMGNSSGSDGLSFWEAVCEITNEALGSLQSNLPSHIFLAFASSLVREGGTEELRARAVQLIADRSLSLDAWDPEAALFRDMLPFLTTLLKDAGDGKLLRQSALVAIESIARALCIAPGDTGMGKSHHENFALAILKSAELVEGESKILSKPGSSFIDLPSPSRQLVCSASLCVATTIRICGPRALPALPKLMGPMICILSAANTFLGSRDDKGVDESQAKLMQLSILRSLISISETLPQFLSPYLDSLFDPLVVPSGSLRSGTDDQSVAVKIACDRLDGILASRVPARQLIPAISGAIVISKHAVEIQVLLSILIASIKESKGAELGGQVGVLLKAATFVFDKSADSPDDERESLANASNELLLSLILKLSEVQLRSLYARLREWRGDIDKNDPTVSASQRVNFWRFSSCLGKQLKSIYLPCLSTVFSDSVDELVSIFKLNAPYNDLFSCLTNFFARLLLCAVF